MYIAWINKSVYTDGPGRRASVAVQGCSIRCPGCQVPQTWKHRTGQVMSVEQVAQELLATGLPVTIMGGEPFDQALEVGQLVKILKLAGRHVIVYTGYVLDDLACRTQDDLGVRMVLGLADVLVDGPFKQDQDHGRLAYRGSQNQRPIDLSHWRETGQVQVLDWDDNDEITILADGTLLAPEEVIRELEQYMGGTSNSTRRCGQGPEQEVA